VVKGLKFLLKLVALLAEFRIQPKVVAQPRRYPHNGRKPNPNQKPLPQIRQPPPHQFHLPFTGLEGVCYHDASGNAPQQFLSGVKSPRQKPYRQGSRPEPLNGASMVRRNWGAIGGAWSKLIFTDPRSVSAETKQAESLLL